MLLWSRGLFLEHLSRTCLSLTQVSRETRNPAEWAPCQVQLPAPVTQLLLYVTESAGALNPHFCGLFAIFLTVFNI